MLRARRFWLFVLAGFFVVPAAILIVAAAHTHNPPATVQITHTDRPDASVRAALDATTAAQRFDFKATTTATPPGITLHAYGTMNVHPRAMVATSDVSGPGGVTSWVNTTSVWERGGGQYGLVPGTPTGPGAPLSGFAPLVQSSLGRREGAVAMMGLASPTGQLELADNVITSATKVDTTTVDGVQVTEYELTFDAGGLVNRPDMSDEEHTAATAAYAVMKQEGYLHTVARVSIDDAGLIRRVQSVAAFADGGMVSSDVTFSDFGSAPVVEMPTP